MDDLISRADVEQTVEDNILVYAHSDRAIDQDPDTECHKAIRTALRMLRKDLRKLPSAQLKIIHCKDCKFAEVADKEDNQDGYTCQFHRGSIWFSGSYCSWAERQEE